MKFLNTFVSFILRSHLVVTLAATFLAYQSLLLTGDYNFRNYILLLIFSGTVFVYNLAHLIIHIPSGEKTAPRNFFLRNSNIRFHIILCVLSFAGFLIGFSKANLHERIVIILTGICAIAYEMPFSKNNKRLKGFRNIPFVKNILLAAVWAVATAWLPLINKMAILHPLDIFFICLKRFFFVLPLALVFDVRDHFNDLKNNVKTISNQYGIQTTKNLALFSMLFFVAIVFLHKRSMETIASPLLDFSIPLYISAVVTSVFILLINASRKNAYYIFVIDGSMILQFLLVYLFSCLK